VALSSSARRTGSASERARRFDLVNDHYIDETSDDLALTAHKLGVTAWHDDPAHRWTGLADCRYNLPCPVFVSSAACYRGALETSPAANPSPVTVEP
jgi:hypothetical protein